MVAQNMGILENNVLFGFVTNGDGKTLERNGAVIKSVAKMQDEPELDLECELQQDP